MLKQIETAADFLLWAHEINAGLMTPKNKPDYQDTYAHSSRNKLDELISHPEILPQLSVVFCAIYNTMSYDEVEHMLKVRAAHKVKQAMEAEYKELDEQHAARVADWNRREADLARREQAFKAAMKPYHKRLGETRRQRDNYRAECDRLERNAEWYKAEAKKAAAQAIDDHEDAKKYRQIKQLIA